MPVSGVSQEYEDITSKKKKKFIFVLINRDVIFEHKIYKRIYKAPAVFIMNSHRMKSAAKNLNH